MPVVFEQFIQNLVQSGLMSVEEVSSFQESLPSEKKPTDAQALARELILARKLTKFQAEKVYQGQTKGLVFDEYVVFDKIGEGGMGQVFKARHRTMERIVALKMLPKQAMKSPDAVTRFHREVRAAGKLMHANIVAALDAREYGGLHGLVMEFVDGKDLAAVVKDRGPLPVETAVDCVLQAARGLEYAHGQGIVHRDIKPSNLLVDGKGTVKILDMGLARMFDEGADGGTDRLTGSGQVMGTCDYMAPEQGEDTHAADHRADIYSLGCTLYRLLTGSPPYPGETLLQILLAHHREPIPSLCEARPDVPVALDAIFQKMMAKGPEDRYQSMTDVITALEACVAVRGPVPSPAVDESSSNGALTSFLQDFPTAGVATKQKAARVAEDTLKSDVEQDTSDNIWTKLVPADRRRMWTYAGIGGGAAFLVVLLAIVLMLKTPEGTLVVEVDEPGAEILVDDGKVTITMPDDKEPVEIQVEEGKHTLKVTKGGFQTHTETFKIKSGARETLRVTLAPLANGDGSGETPEFRMLRGHTDAVNCVTFTPDGKSVVSGSSDGSVRVWDVATGEEIRRFLGHSSSVVCLDVSPDGKSVLSQAGPKLIHWELDTSQEMQQFSVKSHGPVSVNMFVGGKRRAVQMHRVAFSPVGGRAVCNGPLGPGTGCLRLLDLTSGRELGRFCAGNSISDSVTAVAIFPDGTHALCGHWQKPTLRVVDLGTLSEVSRTEQHREVVTGVAISGDGRRAVSGSWDKMVRIWDLPDFTPTASMKVAAWITGVDISADGSRAVSGCKGMDSTQNAIVQLWDAGTGREIARHDKHEKGVLCVAISEDGRWVISGSQDTTLCLWQLKASSS